MPVPPYGVAGQWIVNSYRLTVLSGPTFSAPPAFPPASRPKLPPQSAYLWHWPPGGAPLTDQLIVEYPPAVTLDGLAETDTWG